MRSGDCGAVADGLRGVLVGGCGGVVGSVDLIFLYQLGLLEDLRVLLFFEGAAF